LNQARDFGCAVLRVRSSAVLQLGRLYENGINMKIDIIEINGIHLAELISDEIIIIEPQDALDIMAEAGYLGSVKLIFHEKNLGSDFFDLKSGLAGEILQKFSNYRVQLAIISDHTKFSSKSLRDFISESNRQGRIFFVNSRDEAIKKLAG